MLDLQPPTNDVTMTDLAIAAKGHDVVVGRIDDAPFAVVLRAGA